MEMEDQNRQVREFFREIRKRIATEVCQVVSKNNPGRLRWRVELNADGHRTRGHNGVVHDREEEANEQGDVDTGTTTCAEVSKLAVVRCRGGCGRCRGVFAWSLRGRGW